MDNKSVTLKNSGIEYNIEKYSYIADELNSLAEKHYYEVEDGRMPFKINKDAYIEIDRNDGLLLITARDNGELIGYILNFISNSLHNADSLTSTNDAIYVKPGYRGMGIFKQLFERMEDELKISGVEYVVMTIKKQFDIGLYLEEKGFNEIEHNYEKYLGE